MSVLGKITPVKAQASEVPGAPADFLPGIRQVTDHTPHHVAWAFPLVLMVALALGIVWAMVSEMQIVTAAQGRLVPSGKVKIVQPLESGTVKAIHVSDGQRVEAGETLIELDPSATAADRNRLDKQLSATLVTISRLDAALSEAHDLIAPPQTDPSLVETERSVLRADRARIEGEVALLRKENLRIQRSQAMVSADIERLEAIIPLIRQRVEARETLVNKQYASSMEFLALRQELIEKEGELAIARESLRQAQAEAALNEETMAQKLRIWRHDLVAQLADAERNAGSLEEDLKKAELRLASMVIKAPESGRVHELAVNTVGGVVQPGEPLLKVIPDDAPLVVEAKVPPRDAGFVRVGQAVQVKLDSFNFTKYGAIPGSITKISSDTVDDQALGPVYMVQVTLDAQEIMVDGAAVALTPGMAATADISTGSRTAIDYILAPLQRYQDESLRER